MKRSLAVVALVIVVSAIVAVGASDFGLLLPAVGGSVGPSWLVRTGGGIAALAGLLLLIRQRKRNPRRGDRAADPTAAALGAAATIMCVLAVIALLSPRMTVEEITDAARRQTSTADSAGGEAGTNAALLPQAADPGGRGGGVGPSGGGGGRRQQPDRVDAPSDGIDSDLLSQLGDRLPLILLFVVAIITFLALTGRFGRRSPPVPAEPHALAAEDAEAVLRASLDAFDYTGDDPRLQITAMYHRLLRALAAAGAPREPQEAPYEYLRRALEPLGVTSQPMLELTELYVVAQFSELPITNEHRGRAIAALESALSDLRSVAVEQPAA